ncbi:MAG: CapA family protein, partial [Acidimicrobiia bacterium]
TPVRVTVVGDIHMQGAALGLLDPANESSRLALANLVQGSDVTIGNLESALGVGGAPEHKDFTFLAPLETLDMLGAVGFDVLTMANNHGLDYGRDLIPQAVAASGRGGVSIVGIGRNAAEAYAPYVADVRGVRVAVIGLSDVFDDAGSWSATDTRGGLASVRDMARVDAAVRSASSIADYTIVYLHWGTEREVCPSDRQRALVNQLAADGADAIVGAHAHRVQGSGFVGSTFVSYGLGNFIWYQDGGDSGRSEAVSFELSDSVVKGFSVTPVTIHLGIPSADAPEKMPEAQQIIEKRATCAGVSPTPIQSATP